MKITATYCCTSFHIIVDMEYIRNFGNCKSWSTLEKMLKTIYVGYGFSIFRNVFVNLLI